MMVSVGNGTYKCRFCRNVWTDPAFAAQASVTAAPVTAPSVGGTEPKNCGTSVYEKNINGVLEIECGISGGISQGSGFLIADGGYAITNTHVVTDHSAPCRDITVRLAGETVPATIVALGDDRGGHGNGVDLALLKLSRVPRNAVIVKLADFSTVKVGESVYVIGNSLGYGTCITGGIVSDRCRNVNGDMLLMTDCAVNGGNSGGPIFNASGLAIGAIVSGITSAEGMNFAIPSNTVMEFIRKYGKGISMRGITKYDYVSCDKVCPSCKGREVKRDAESGIYWCTLCDYEF